MDKEMQIFAPEGLPLDLGELGVVTEADLVMPGVYDVILENSETGVVVEGFIVLRSAVDISDMAKRYGKSNPDYPELLIYTEDSTGNSRYIIGYELFRYRILHQLALPEGESIRSIAAIGAEMYPEYFGGYPVPLLTPWGYTTRNKVIANGLYWLETEQCQRGLALASPIYDDLSDGARGLAERYDNDSSEYAPAYLFFRESDSCVPLFELLSEMRKERLYCEINWAALMNAVYHCHPEYAAQHNLAEQVGLNDGFGRFLHTMGLEVELRSSPERLLSLTAQAGREFIDF